MPYSGPVQHDSWAAAKGRNYLPSKFVSLVMVLSLATAAGLSMTAALAASDEEAAAPATEASARQDGEARDAQAPPVDAGAKDGPTAAAIQAPLTPETGFIADSPRRLTDGSFFVPKPAQRLIALRTVVTAAMDVPRTDEIPGNVIADPNASGEVQTHQTGRIETVDTGMPLVGTAVTKGQLLAYVTPTVSRVERGTIFAEAAEIAVEIEKRQRQIAFLQDFAIVPFRERKVGVARIELEGLRKRYDVLTRALSAKIALRAPVDGVIASIHAVPGQIVDARAPIFHIVDPKRLMIQATAIDAHVPEKIRSAHARFADGRTLPVRFVGRGPQLQNQAVPLIFATDGDIPLVSVGAAVTVVVQGSDSRAAIVLPRESMVRAPSGDTVVWEKLGPERFVARPVVAHPLSGDKLSIIAGLAPGVRAVTHGANFLSSVR